MAQSCIFSSSKYLAMPLKANYEFLFIGRDDNSFLENYYYDLFQDFGEKSGQIFINLEVQNNPVDAEEIGQMIFEAMQKVFFEDIERDPYERFEVALKAVNEGLKKFKSEKFSGYIGNLNVIIAAIVGNVLYLAQAGDAEAYLIRKKYVSIVSEGLNEGGEGGDVFTTIASGTIESGDFVMFSSSRLLRYVSKTDLAKCVTKTSVIESLSEIRDTVSSEILGRVGLTGILFNEATKAELNELSGEDDTINQSLLESSDTIAEAKKQTLTGKFFTALQGFGGKAKSRAKKYEVFKGVRGKGGVGGAQEWLKNFWNGLFTKGFGRDKMLALLVVLIVVLVLGIWFVGSSTAERAEIARLDKVLTSVQDNISSAQTKGTYDKESAKTILDKAYLDAMSVLNSGYYRDKAKTYLQKIDEVRDTLDNVKRVENPKVVADLSAKRPDVSALGLVEVGGRIFAYEYNALYEIVLDQVQDPLTINKDETVIAATGFGDRNSIVFMTKTGKLIEYRGGIMSFMDTDDGSFRKGTALTSWSNRIYILDPSGNQVWRYTYKGTRDAFGNAEGYLAEQADLSKARDFTIDASIYVLGSDGAIDKFYGGKKAQAVVNNAPFKAFRDPAVIYTNEKLSQVFVLDAKEGRILVFDKNARTGNLDYNSQYLLPSVGELRDLYVDATSQKMYVLTASKMYEVDLASVSAPVVSGTTTVTDTSATTVAPVAGEASAAETSEVTTPQ